MVVHNLEISRATYFVRSVVTDVLKPRPTCEDCSISGKVKCFAILCTITTSTRVIGHLLNSSIIGMVVPALALTTREYCSFLTVILNRLNTGDIITINSLRIHVQSFWKSRIILYFFSSTSCSAGSRSSRKALELLLLHTIPTSRHHQRPT